MNEPTWKLRDQSVATPTDEVELVPANPWVPRLLTAIAVVLIGTGSWLCLGARRAPRPKAPAPAEAKAEHVGSDYALEAPSWGTTASATPAKPERPRTERERQDAEFAARAAEQWQGVEIFVRKR